MQHLRATVVPKDTSDILGLCLLPLGPTLTEASHVDCAQVKYINICGLMAV